MTDRDLNFTVDDKGSGLWSTIEWPQTLLVASLGHFRPPLHEWEKLNLTVQHILIKISYKV